MKKLGLIFFLLTVSIFATSCSGKEPGKSRAMINLECGDTYDWGTVWVKSETVLETQVKIFNSGKDTLVISEVHPSCGCTTAPIDKDRIEPAGYAVLSISLTPGIS